MKGFSIRVHVGNPPRKQNLHARKPGESSAKGVRQGRAAKAAAKAGHSGTALQYSCAHGQCSAKATAKAKTVRAKEPQKPSRKFIRIRTKSLPGFRRCSVSFLLSALFRLIHSLIIRHPQSNLVISFSLTIYRYFFFKYIFYC